jgi:ribosome-associated protein
LQAQEAALLCATYAADKKAEEMNLLDVRGLSSLTDYLLLCNGRSDRQVQAIAEGIRMGLKENHGLSPLAVEGMNEGRWVLLDYGDVMIHVFQQPVRLFYDLDGLWAEAPQVNIPAEHLGLSGHPRA